MTILQVLNRPVVVFDVNNTEHRKWFAQFLKNRSWQGVPVRFIASEVTEVDVGTMTRQLIQYYANQEFENLLTQ